MGRKRERTVTHKLRFTSSQVARRERTSGQQKEGEVKASGAFCGSVDQLESEHSNVRFTTEPARVNEHNDIR